MNEQGAIIFVDELDKCAVETGWNAFLRTEVFSLCDARVPSNLKTSNDDRISEARILKAQEFLANKTMILAGAAFQYIWEERSKPSMGFLPPESGYELPELPDLVRFLPREMINRFSSEVFILPELTIEDYRVMVETMAKQIPEHWRKRFLELGLSRLDLAVRHQKGARYMEEVLLSAIVAERESLANFIPVPKPAAKTKVDESGEPDLTIGGFKLLANI